MQGPIDKSLALLSESTREGLYDALVSQLQKDFDRANVAVEFNGEEAPEILTSRLHEKLYQLIMERFAKYLNLLYVIDIPERTLKKVPLTDPVDMAREVGYLILDRERQKVRMKRDLGS